MTESLHFPTSLRTQLEPYLPPQFATVPSQSSQPAQPPHPSSPSQSPQAPQPSAALQASHPLHSPQDSHPHPQPALPFITLTYATSLDSHLSLSPGVQTLLSGPESKAMTHYLRTRHDAILVGSGTAVADDPGLNSRLEDIAGVSKEEGLAMQPRPVVLDRRGRWEVGRESKVVRLAREGRGKGPWVFTSKVDEGKRKVVEAVGGRVFEIPEVAHFEHIVSVLAREGIRSLMVEGGGTVINEILAERQSRRLVSSVIVTIAPTYLGKGGVNVSPEHEAGKENAPVMRFDDVQWMPLGQDVVMLGKMPADAG